MCACVVLHSLSGVCYCVIVLPVPPLLSPSVGDELQEADLITSDEHARLVYTSDMVRVQSGKSPEILTKTADVLRRHILPRIASLLTGKRTLSHIHVRVVCCTVEPSYKCHLKASIIVSFPHPVLGHSECVPEPHCLPTWPPEALACTH